MHNFSVVGLGSVALVIALSSGPKAETAPMFLGQWGGDRLSSPVGVCVDADGNVYVADAGHDRVLKYTWNGTLLDEVGSTGVGDGQFETPVDALVHPTGLVYIADSSPRMQVFDATLSFVTKWGPDYPGGNRAALDPTGQNIYFTRLFSIYEYTVAGSFVRSWATSDVVNSVLYGIAVGRSGAVYVADYGLSKVWKYSATGVLLGSWGGPGAGDGEFRGALAVAVDDQENVYVSDGARIQKFSADGKFLVSFGASGSGDGQFYYPSDLAIDSRGLIFVVDKDNNRIDVFGDPSIGTKSTTWGRLKALYR